MIKLIWNDARKTNKKDRIAQSIARSLEVRYGYKIVGENFHIAGILRKLLA